MNRFRAFSSVLSLVLFPLAIAATLARWWSGGHFCADSAFSVVVFGIWWVEALCRFIEWRAIQSHPDECECCEVVPDEA